MTAQAKIQIEGTPGQQKQVRQPSGKQPSASKLALGEAHATAFGLAALEERLAPIRTFWAL